MARSCRVAVLGLARVDPGLPMDAIARAAFGFRPGLRLSFLS